jgi:ABC-type bacteriocin/lantibiotic exporter with double-glycine peptidase domain
MQMQAADCGAASLKMILDYYNSFYSLEEVRQLIGVGVDGSTIGDIRQGAAHTGLELEALELDLDSLHKLQPPFILWWDHVHFVVYEGKRNNIEIINDPALGRRHLSKQEFIAAWTGVVIYPLNGDRIKKSKSKAIVSSLDIITSLISGSEKLISLAFLLSVSGIIPAIFLAQLTSYFTDQVLVDSEYIEAKSLLWSFFALTGVTALLSSTSYYISNRTAYAVSVRRSIVFFKFILSLPVTWHESRTPQEIATRILLPSQMINTLTYSFMNSLGTVTKSFLILVFVFFVNIWLGTCFLGLFIIVLLSTVFITVSSSNANQLISVENGKQGSIALSTLGNLEKIRSVGQENAQYATWAGYYTNFTNAGQKVSQSQSYTSLVSVSGTYLFTTILIVAGPILIIKNQISIGDFIGLQFLVGYLAAGVSTIPSLLTQYQTAISPVTRIRDAFEADYPFTHKKPSRIEELELTSKSHSLHKNPSDQLASIAFNSVLFENTRSHVTFSNLNITIDPHKLTALSSSNVQASTSFLKLLCGLIEPKAGQVLLNSNGDISSPTPGDIRYFSGESTILDINFAANVNLMDGLISRDDIMHTIQMVRLFDYVKRFSNGIYSRLPSHGRGLSHQALIRLTQARIVVERDSFTAIDSFIDRLPMDDSVNLINCLRSRNIGSILVCNSETLHDLFDEVIDLDTLAECGAK